MPVPGRRSWYEFGSSPLKVRSCTTESREPCQAGNRAAFSGVRRVLRGCRIGGVRSGEPAMSDVSKAGCTVQPSALFFLNRLGDRDCGVCREFSAGCGADASLKYTKYSCVGAACPDTKIPLHPLLSLSPPRFLFLAILRAPAPSLCQKSLADLACQRSPSFHVMSLPALVPLSSAVLFRFSLFSLRFSLPRPRAVTARRRGRRLDVPPPVLRPP